MKLITGRPLIGFFGLFENNFGDAATESPMRTITPSFVGSAMLPFRCPKCKDVCQDLACPTTREYYKDSRRGRDNHWCPSCGCRFKIDMAGTPLPCALAAGAIVGPSKVECAGETSWQDVKTEPKLFSAVIGVLFPASTKNGYLALTRRAT